MTAETLTIHRSSPNDIIWVPISIPAPGSSIFTVVMGELDTGLDHTCIRRNVLDELGYRIVGEPINVAGITGDASGIIMTLPVRIVMDGGYVFECELWDFVVVTDMKLECLLGRDMLRMFDVDIRRNGTAILKR